MVTPTQCSACHADSECPQCGNCGEHCRADSYGCVAFDGREYQRYNGTVRFRYQKADIFSTVCGICRKALPWSPFKAGCAGWVATAYDDEGRPYESTVACDEHREQAAIHVHERLEKAEREADAGATRSARWPHLDCALCGAPAREATKRCDRCWELETRINDNPKLALELVIKALREGKL